MRERNARNQNRIRGHGDEPATATDIYYIDSKDHKEVRQDREFHIIGHFTQSEATISTLIKTSTGEKKLLFTNQFILNPITSSITRLYSSPSELGYPVSSQMEK